MAGKVFGTTAPELVRALSEVRREGPNLLVVTFFLNLLILTTSIYMWQIFDRVFTSGSMDTLAFLSVIAAIALVAYAALEIARRRILARSGIWLEKELGPRVIDASLQAKLRGASLGAQGLRDLAGVRNFLSGESLTAFMDAPWFPVFAFLIYLVHPVLGILSVIGAFLLVTCAYLNDRLSQARLAAANTGTQSANLHAEQAIANAEAVKAMGMREAVISLWNHDAGRARDDQLGAADTNTNWTSVAKFIRFGLQVGVLGTGAFYVLAGEMTAGGMIAASILLGRALAPAERAIGSWRGYKSAKSSLANLDKILNALPPAPERLTMPEPKGEVEATNLRYAPPGAQEPTLQQVTFKLMHGECCVVIGPSGAGKSTLCRLLVGAAEPQYGEVRLDGVEVRHWPPEQIGAYIGYAPQDAALFSGPIARNISRLQEPDSDKVVEAATLARAHDLILRLPDGYETDVGVGGSRLSGGQRQRVALARALYGDPKLVVLDEPDAHLDEDGRAALLDCLKDLKARGVTVIIVSHVSQIANAADKALVLENGRSTAFAETERVLAAIAQRRRQFAEAAAAAKPRLVSGGGQARPTAAATPPTESPHGES